MDAAATGALIGIGMMACLVVTVFCYEKARPWSIVLRKRYRARKQQQQPLLPVVVVKNRLITRRQFQVKHLFQKK